jgi:hypothetical protein
MVMSCLAGTVCHSCGQMDSQVLHLGEGLRSRSLASAHLMPYCWKCCSTGRPHLPWLPPRRASLLSSLHVCFWSCRWRTRYGLPAHELVLGRGFSWIDSRCACNRGVVLRRRRGTYDRVADLSRWIGCWWLW